MRGSLRGVDLFNLLFRIDLRGAPPLTPALGLRVVLDGCDFLLHVGSEGFLVEF